MARPTFGGKEIYDLTQPLSHKTPRSSDHPEVRFEALRWRSRHGSHTTTASFSVHQGTHIDAPSGKLLDGLSIDEVPLDRFCGPAVIVDIQKDDWGEIGPDDLSASPEPIAAGDIVVLRTGWHRFYGDEERYILKAPGLTKDGVDWLVERGVRLVASDTPSPEHIFMRARQWSAIRPDVFDAADIDPEKFPRSYAHKTLLAQGICLLESLGGEIGDVPVRRAEVLAMPLKYAGVEAAQARVIALVET